MQFTLHCVVLNSSLFKTIIVEINSLNKLGSLFNTEILRKEPNVICENFGNEIENI